MAFRAFPPEVAGYTTKFCALHPTHLLLLATITGVKSYLLNNSTVLWSEAKVCTVIVEKNHLELRGLVLSALLFTQLRYAAASSRFCSRRGKGL